MENNILGAMYFSTFFNLINFISDAVHLSTHFHRYLSQNEKESALQSYL